ncbi:hypothetical protein BJAS_P3491 [Bathymodiolus japonicus methanotrophic gill symbiont]|uniref:hypothetical protein n=1 Tax=Bathymodiolus japonicus methanotrophic gill symbiont TaxID=113269 RepID=UPI001B4A0E83|nr:hypothetical protein [Bathymodiolus japonicus methanotrophic gill symbiont]GFO72954.1 hypothetical protein BJAS_P3491 [Bathymodiolus japonicus methanotrophic gill symbiont]
MSTKILEVMKRKLRKCTTTHDVDRLILEVRYDSSLSIDARHVLTWYIKRALVRIEYVDHPIQFIRYRCAYGDNHHKLKPEVAKAIERIQPFMPAPGILAVRLFWLKVEQRNVRLSRISSYHKALLLNQLGYIHISITKFKKHTIQFRSKEVHSNREILKILHEKNFKNSIEVIE